MAEDAGGAIYSFEQLVNLLIGLSLEGESDYVSKADAAKLVAKPHRYQRYQSIYQEILAAMLLFGRFKIALPTNVAAELDVERLVREDLIEVIDTDFSESVHGRVCALYEGAFKYSRHLEVNPAFKRRLRSLDERVRQGGSQDIIDAHLQAGEIEFYLGQLVNLVAPIERGTRDLYGYAWESSQRLFHETYSEANNELARSATRRPLPREDGRLADIIAAMGIGPRYDFDAFDLASVFHAFAYTPDDMIALHELDYKLVTRLGGFRGYVETGLQFAFRSSPEDFFEVQSFWRTFFEMLGMLNYSTQTSSPIFVPSEATVRTVNSDADTTQDLLRVYRIYLQESGVLPVPRTLDDLLRLREDGKLRSLKKALSRWATIQTEGADYADLLSDIKAEIAAADKIARRLDAASRFASLIGYIALPVGIAEAVTNGSLFGLLLSPIGPAVDTYKILKLRHFGWVKFGK